jgi:hypothetical protein
MLLRCRNLAIETAKEVDELRVVVDLSFRVVAGGKLLQQDLGEASGGSLEASFGKLVRIVTAYEVDEVILVEATLQEMLLLETPLEIPPSRPIGDVAVRDCEAGLPESNDDVPVRNSVPKHVVDHVALEFGQTRHVTVALGLAEFCRRRQRFGINDRCSFGRRNRSGDDGAVRCRLKAASCNFGWIGNKDGNTGSMMLVSGFWMLDP